VRRLVTAVALSILVAVPAASVRADTVSPLNVTLDFNEYPFPAPTQILQGPDGTSSVTYNLFDDATGADLASDNGDLPDVTLVYRTSPPGALATPGLPSIEVNPTAVNQLTGRTGYTDPPTMNNMGTRQSYTIEVRLAPHIEITDVTIDTSSINTAGTTWEFTVVSFLDQSGAPFSPIPAIPAYLAFEPGLTGSSGTGHFLAAETGTVTGVGTDLTSSGTSGSHDQVNDTVSNSDVTLPGGALIGGFILTTTLEDVAGVDNAATAFSSSIRQVDLAGTINQVVPDAEVSIAKFGDVIDNEVVFEVLVTNNGPDAATNVVVTDVLPAEVAYLSDDCGASDIQPWTWQVGTVADGETVTCTVTTELVTPGVIENEATVTADEDDVELDNNTASVVVDTNATEATTTTISATSTTPPTETTQSTLPFTGSGDGEAAVLVAGSLVLAGLLLVAASRRHGRAGLHF
jgi:uncharacterized repeat protein (TIGR01451 family)